MRKKVLVTGSTGFIGKYVVNELLKRDFHVIASSRASDIPEEWKGKLSGWVPLDLSSLDESADYFSICGSPDLMIHLAWEGLPNYNAEFHYAENLPRHLLFLRNMIQGGLRDLTVAGTCLEYGMQEGCLSEEMNCLPSNPYARAKHELLLALTPLAEKYAVSFKWARLFYMYGKGQNPKSLTSQLDAALERGEEAFNMSGGEQERDFLPVETMAAYIVELAIQNRITGVINCCSGKPVRVLDFVEHYLAKRGARIKLNTGYYPYPDYEPMFFWGDNKKIKSIINNE
jgi:dTDP-6-deoxy-L-talose 4-dehydrogenase (NAD+)